MRVSDAFPSDYLRATDLQGRNILVKIDRVEFVEMNKERKLALFFIGKDKGMILNKTNANAISAAYGDDTDDWRDQEIMLFMAMVDFQGKTVEALRVKIPPRKAAPRQTDRAEGRRDAPPPRDDYRGDEGRRAPAMANDDPIDDIPF